MKTAAPEKIWISLPYGRHPDDWSFTDMPELANGRVAYVQAEGIERLRKALHLMLEIAPRGLLNAKEELALKAAYAALAGKEDKT